MCGGAFALDFNEPAVKAADLEVSAAVEAGQGLVGRFNKVKEDIARMEKDTRGLSSDLDYLDRRASFMTDTGIGDITFQVDLRDTVLVVKSYTDSARSIKLAMIGLLADADKSQELNQIAVDMGSDAGRLLDRVEYDIDRAVGSLERTVLAASPSSAGQDAHSQVADMANYSSQFVVEMRGIEADTRELIIRTRP